MACGQTPQSLVFHTCTVWTFQLHTLWPASLSQFAHTFIVSASVSVWLANAIGCPSCNKAAPMPFLRTSHWMVSSFAGAIEHQDGCAGHQLLYLMEHFIMSICPLPCCYLLFVIFHLQFLCIEIIFL